MNILLIIRLINLCTKSLQNKHKLLKDTNAYIAHKS